MRLYYERTLTLDTCTASPPTLVVRHFFTVLPQTLRKIYSNFEIKKPLQMNDGKDEDDYCYEDDSCVEEAPAVLHGGGGGGEKSQTVAPNYPVNAETADVHDQV